MAADIRQGIGSPNYNVSIFSDFQPAYTVRNACLAGGIDSDSTSMPHPCPSLPGPLNRRTWEGFLEELQVRR